MPPNEAKSPRSLISERSERLHSFISEASSLALAEGGFIEKGLAMQVLFLACPTGFDSPRATRSGRARSDDPPDRHSTRALRILPFDSHTRKGRPQGAPFYVWPARQDSILRAQRAPVGRDLTIPRIVIQHAPFESSLLIAIREKGARKGRPFTYGLPDRIRTCDLESRSLTRYPAVPRAESRREGGEI